MTGSRLIGLLIAILAIGAVVYFFSPGFRAKVDDMWGKHGGWTAEARKKDPVGFIDFSIKKLDDAITKFEEVRRDLRTAQSKLEDTKRQNDEKLAFTEKQLAEFKSVYQGASGGGGWPASVAGRNYTEAELKSQVELLLTQKTGFEGVIAQATEALKTVELQFGDLQNRINDSKAKLDLLSSQREMVKVSQLNAATEKMLAEVNQVLEENDATQRKSAVRTVDELMKDAKVAARATPKADDFLKS